MADRVCLPARDEEQYPSTPPFQPASFPIFTPDFAVQNARVGKELGQGRERPLPCFLHLSTRKWMEPLGTTQQTGLKGEPWSAVFIKTSRLYRSVDPSQSLYSHHCARTLD